MVYAMLNDRIRLLRELAKLRGIVDSYCDVEGEEHETSDEVRAELLEACGYRTATIDDLRAAIEMLEREPWERVLEPAIVLKQSEARTGFRFQLPGVPVTVRCRVACEDGGDESVASLTREELLPVEEREINGRRHYRYSCPLPAGIDLGYYAMTVTVATEHGESLEASTRLIITPERAYLPEWYERGEKVAGVAISLYGLRSESDAGSGELGALRRFMTWASDSLGADFIGLNPIHAIYNRQPYNASPYLPTTRLYRNFLYIDLSGVPEFSASSEAQRLWSSNDVRGRVETLRASDTVQYEAAAALKLELLEIAYEQFLQSGDEARRRAFDAYAAAEGRYLDEYATFCAIYESVRKSDPDVWSWGEWPVGLQDPDGAAVAGFRAEHASRIGFFKYLQWLLDEQLHDAALQAERLGMRIGLYLDLALAVDRHGADYWAHRDLFVAAAKSGAPPDPLGPQGQDWQFPPPDREKYRADGYRYFSEKIRRNCKYAGALRLDHVMRLARLFWIPLARTAVDGAYVLDYGDDLLKIISLESVRNRTMIIGEDLGTVPDWIREKLAEYGILSYRVFYFERHPDGSFKRPDEFPALSIATLSTHDLPTLAGFWEESDIDRREAAGLLEDEEARREFRLDRKTEKHRMTEALGIPADCPLPKLRDAVFARLAATGSAIVLLNQEDLFLEREQQNMPGTTVEHLNWARRMLHSIEELESDAAISESIGRVRNVLEAHGRVRPARAESRRPTIGEGFNS